MKIVINDVLRNFLKKYKTAYAINNGACEEFMQTVLKRFPKAEEKVTENYTDEYGCIKINGIEFSLLGHFWIYYEGKHYDAETPSGVKDWKKLLIFNKTIKKGK